LAPSKRQFPLLYRSLREQGLASIFGSQPRLSCTKVETGSLYAVQTHPYLHFKDYRYHHNSEHLFPQNHYYSRYMRTARLLNL